MVKAMKRGCHSCTYWRGNERQDMAACDHPETVASRTYFNYCCQFYVQTIKSVHTAAQTAVCAICGDEGRLVTADGWYSCDSFHTWKV